MPALSKILSRRFTGILDKNQPQDQAGFHFGFSNTDQLQAIKQVTEKPKSLILKFTRLSLTTKGCVSVEQEFVLQELKNEGVEYKHISKIWNTYNHTYARN
jgi:hypothetical protein